MRVVWSWLGEYVDLSGVSTDDLAARWTLAGLEVKAVERIGDWWDRERLLVGAVTRVEPHPNADRLVLADVDLGTGTPHRVVTGAPNLLPLREGGDLERPLKIVFAREGVELYDGYQEGWVKTKLKGRKVRGVMSDAMVCSEKEIGLSESHEGILVLDDDAPVGAPLADVLGDTVIELDLTPNYARALSMVGVARETAALLDRPFAAPEPTVTTAGGDVTELVEIVIDDPDLCPRYAARLVRGVEPGPSPAWLARRLTLAGMRPINNIVDVTNYVMLEWGEPLHAFDYDRLVERAGGGRPTIIMRRARPGERMTTLDGEDRALDEDTLMITDTAGPIAIGGVMGGTETEVGPDTENVLIEAAAFDFINNRRTSRAQRLDSEAAARFGRGVHPALVAPASKRSAELMRELAGGTVVDGVADAYPRPPAPVVVALDPADVARVLGLAIPTDEIQAILQRLEFEVEPGDGGMLVATVPPHRLDVSVPADLIEEVARVHGYDRLPSTLMTDTLPPQRDNPGLALEEATRDVLAAAGLQEIVSYRLVAIEREALLVPGHVAEPEGYVRVANPISPERAWMRRSILTGLLEAAAGNLRFTEHVALFEVGQVYHRQPDAKLPDEPRRVGLVMTGPSAARTWRGGDRRALDFYDAKGAVTSLLEALGVAAEWVPGSHPSLHPGRTAEIRAAGASLGHAGELHPVVRERLDLGDGAVVAADLDLDALAAVAVDARLFTAFSAYPVVRQDLAVVVDEDVAAGDVAAAVRAAGGSLLVDVALFDVYRGEQVGEGKKSLAWSLTFQALDKTLGSRAVDAVRARIVGVLERELGAQLR